MSTPVAEVKPEFVVKDWHITPWQLKDSESGPRLAFTFILRETLLGGEKRLQLRGNALYSVRSGSTAYDVPANAELYAIVRNFIRNNEYLRLLWTFE